jgi:hypothetical protein
MLVWLYCAGVRCAVGRCAAGAVTASCQLGFGAYGVGCAGTHALPVQGTGEQQASEPHIAHTALESCLHTALESCLHTALESCLPKAISYDGDRVRLKSPSAVQVVGPTSSGTSVEKQHSAGSAHVVVPLGSSCNALG